MLLHRHRAIIWYAFGVAWLNSTGGGVVLKTMLSGFVLECGFAEFLYRGLPLSFKAQCLPQIEEGRGKVGSCWMPFCCTDTGLSSGMHLG